MRANALRAFVFSSLITINFGRAHAAEQDVQAWLAATARLPLTQRMAAIVEGYARLADDLDRLTVTQTRVGLQYKFSPSLTATGGYWHVWSYPQNGSTTEEDRIWEELTWRPKSVGGFSPALRTRVEQAFPAGGGKTSWRIREQAKISHPLKAEAGSYLYGSGELFFNLADTARADSGFEQVRFSAGAGFRVGEHARVETGYLSQFQPRDGAEDRLNHILMMTLSFEP